MARECQRELEANVVKQYDVEIMTGKMNLEVRPRFVNKGETAKMLIEHCDGGGKLEFVLCLGDDSTDEGMFWIPFTIEGSWRLMVGFLLMYLLSFRYVSLLEDVNSTSYISLLCHRWPGFETDAGLFASS